MKRKERNEVEVDVDRTMKIFQFEFQLHTFSSRAHGACLEFLIMRLRSKAISLPCGACGAASNQKASWRNRSPGIIKPIEREEGN